MRAILQYLMLPSKQSDFEINYLLRMNRVAIWFFALHVPLFTLIAALNDTGAWFALFSTTAVLVGPALAMKTLEDQRKISTVMGVCAMLMGGLLVHFGQGPIQIEMHF